VAAQASLRETPEQALQAPGEKVIRMPPLYKAGAGHSST